MFDHSLAFNSPGYLLLLLLLPIIWWLGFDSLGGLGPWRRYLALGLRSIVFALIVLALADAQYQRRNDKLTVIYLLDQSLSIPSEERQAMIDYVDTSIQQYHQQDQGDRFAVIIFGRDAAVEIPLVDVAIPLPSRIETVLDPEYTDLASAIQRAKAMFPHDAAKRIVLVTDGNQNLGDARRVARTATLSNVSIDVVPVLLEARGEIAVEKLDIPAAARRGQPFEMRAVLNNDATEENPRTVSGQLRIIRKSGEREETLLTQDVEVPPGKRVFSISDQLDQPDFYTYEARFTPHDVQDDGMVQNNQASAFTHVRGRGHVLLIENWDKQGEFDFLVDRLRGEDIAVTVTPSDRLFTSLAELQRYDAVVLANVSRSTGSDAENVSSFSDQQIDMLVRNTREMGCGLVMIGGPDTYGVGGWTNTALEAAMPVDFEIKNAKVVPVGALVLMMHAGEMPKSNYWQKRIAFESIKILGSRDYCGLVQWSGTDQWLWGQSQGGLIRVGPNRKKMLALTDRMTIGDMPAFDPAMNMAATSFAGVNAAVKHMIIISDGDPTPASATTLRRLVQQQVKVSTVAVGSHGMLGSQEMQRIATQTGGKYYVVKSANALPKIYQREARRIARPLVYEPKPPVQPAIVTPHQMVEGLETVPPVSGFVLTSLKESPLVEVILRSPQPVEEKNSTILAGWIYGAGKTVALTTDAGNRWANQWTNWENYDKFYSQVVRWVMRPTGDTGNFTVATDTRDGATQVIITALDQEEQFLNDQAMTGTIVTPEMETVPLGIEQVAPGRYVGEFPSEEAGSYLIVVNPGSENASIRTGVNIGYSAEYRENETNLALLKSLVPTGANQQVSGQLVEEGLKAELNRPEPALNPFRHDLEPAISNQPIWPWLVVLGSVIFFSDVFVRRVQVDFKWLAAWLAKARDYVLRRQRTQPVPETMSRLRSRKREMSQQFESRRAASTRYEPATEELQETEPLAPSPTKAPKKTQSAAPPDTTAEQAEEPSYTERLLKAKRNVWKEKPRGEDSNDQK